MNRRETFIILAAWAVIILAAIYFTAQVVRAVVA